MEKIEKNEFEEILQSLPQKSQDQFKKQVESLLEKDHLEEKRVALHESAPIKKLFTFSFPVLQTQTPERTEKRILLLGPFGDGKSSLINWLVKKEVCKTSSDIDATTLVPRKIILQDQDTTIVLIDTPGFEPGKKQLFNMYLIRKVITTLDIDLIWYVKNVGNPKIDPKEIDDLRVFALSFNIPIFLVLNKVNERTLQRKRVEWQGKLQTPKLNKIFQSMFFLLEIIVEDENDRPNFDELLKSSGEVLKNEGRMPIADEEKKKQIKKIRRENNAQNVAALSKKCLILILSCAITAVALGASPIPFSDAAMLFPLEIGMICGICKIFDMQLTVETSKLMIKQILRGAAFGFFGWGVANLLKFIPGLNFGIMAIEGSIAFVCVGALGYSCLLLVRSKYLEDVSTDEAWFDEKGLNEIKKNFKMFSEMSKKDLMKFFDDEKRKLGEGLGKESQEDTEAENFQSRLDEQLALNEQVTKKREEALKELMKNKRNFAEYCQICYQELANIKVTPCGHACFCSKDFNAEVKNKRVSCPFCFVQIDGLSIVNLKY